MDVTNLSATSATVANEVVAGGVKLVGKVDTIAALRLLGGVAEGQTIEVLGYDAAGDGGGGPPRHWDADSVCTDNGGSCIDYTGDDGAGRWVWDWSGAVDVKWFGAKGDGVTDDHAAILAALTSLPRWPTQPAGGELVFPHGVYITSAPIVAGLGVRLIGETGNYTTIVKAASGFVGDGVLIMKNDAAADFSTSGSGLKSLRIVANNQPCNGVVIHSGRDVGRYEDIYVSGVADAYNAMRIVSNPLAASTISQTLLFENITLQHSAATATEPTLYIDSLQESTFIGVKSFGGSPNTNAASIPIYVANSRSVTFLSCTSAQTDGDGLVVESTNRFSSGITVIGHAYEDIVGVALKLRGSAIYYNSNISLINPRYEGVIGGGADVEHTTRSQIDTIDRSVRVGTGSQYNRFSVKDLASFTDVSGATNHAYFFGVAPKTYDISNVTPTRAYDASAATLNQVANTLGSLVQDLRDRGILK